MGYIFDFKDVKDYQRWLSKPRTQPMLDMEAALMMRLLKPVSGDTVLDIGCGTGRHLHKLTEAGIAPTGLDASVYMLDVAENKIGQSADLHHGHAENLPFDDNSFNCAIFMNALEFVEDPRQAIAEACRVTKDRLFIGTCNRYAIKNIYRRFEGVFTNSIWNRAKFFSAWELRDLVHTILGKVPVKWRTTCQLPFVANRWVMRIENVALIQHCPFGAFVGMVVILKPRYRTRPLSLKIQSKGHPKTVAG